MVRMLRRNKIITIIVGIAIMALGVGVITNPDGTTLFVTNLIGWILIASGVLGIAGSLYWGLRLTSPFDVAFAIVQIATGALILSMPQTFIGSLFTVLGIMVMIAGIGTVIDAVAVRSLGIGVWIWGLLWGIATICLGLLIVASPYSFAEALTLVAGISLIVSGIGQVALGALLPSAI